jgi:hypothetical protein
MRRCLFIILFFLCGCATTEQRYEQTDQQGIEKVYNYSYDKIFYACEDALPQMAWTIQESNFNKGSIFSRGAFDYSTLSMAILVKTIDGKTRVKVAVFGPIFPKSGIYNQFFYHLQDLLERK